MILQESELNHIIDLMFESYPDNNEKLNVRENGITYDDVMNGITLYHRPKDAIVKVGGEEMKVIDSLFKYGFSREFTSSNGGNMYGAGVYSVYTLKSSNEKATGYGKAIVKLKLLGGYKDFLIFSEQLAKKTYGDRWHIKKQVVDLFPTDLAQKIFNNVHLVMHNDNDSFHNMTKSSSSAYSVIRLLGERNINTTKCRGIVYNGGHDGACCLIRDFSSVVPVAVSYDNGKTWKNRLSQQLIDRMNNEVDTHFQLGGNNEFKDYADKSINGYTIVWNKEGKANYVPANGNAPISNVWFDDGENWQLTPEGIPYVNVKYGDYYLKIFYEDNNYMVYDSDGCPQDCTIDEIPQLIGE